jgi:CBS domain-containing protein
MTIQRICVQSVDHALATESVWRAAERMHQRAVGMLVILDDREHPIGVLTDRDIVERVVAQQRDTSRTKVGDVMTPKPAVVRGDASIESAISMMRCRGVRRLPVIDDSGQLTGIISLDDILALLAEEFTEVGRLLEKQTPKAAAGIH